MVTIDWETVKKFYDVYASQENSTIHTFCRAMRELYQVDENTASLLWYGFDMGTDMVFRYIKANEQQNPTPTNVELIGYKKAKFNQPVTDHMESKDNTKWSIYRISLDIHKPLVVSLGNGRQITIKINSNKTNLGD